jgi:hypothetical protein
MNKVEYFTSYGEPARKLALNSKGKAITNGSCTRCGGSGEHSFCPMYGTTCFKCWGSGTVVVRAYTEKEYKALVKNREKAKAKREVAREALLDKERKRNNGKTNWEVVEEENLKIWKAEKAKKKKVSKLLTPLALDLEDGCGGFCDSMARDLKDGNLPRGRGWYLVCDIIAKSYGRRNSKAYDAAFSKTEETLEKANEMEERMRE